ncbi:MAG TPA: glycerophosphodiester phosphodiesterase family protein [Nocardioides sp.]|uniref:glycerophosphodiester phosphodiesterase family protein n=1 Tax=uncultured Nocardioides sp. TaxID=198441 RepID=UPI000ED1906A|nr:glycerophosphodiester phosphodiesterase family protein [uncultured Nocardioides sp.]HCB05829.1 glycerophosphodiester phosphodiesterase [Nocardioides sp.]HRD60564.1 glycerophosphodiester phosphodiesterase family protein [Nocardioides sp.]HRI96616.1 glycerophosphodiester phosphodiesterase family protein [Nocardioides sp.]
MTASPPRPQVVAHRGASAETAEHTLRAYITALDAGAEALECDVRLTADGHLVCVHDRDLRRTAARKGLVSTSNLEDLEALDFASWKNPWADLDDEAPARDARLDGVLTLRKLLEAVADYDRRVEVAIETKHPTRYGGLVEKRVAEMLHDFGWDQGAGDEPSPARVMSFSFTALQRMERLAPGVRLVQLIDKPREWTLLRRVVGRDWLLGPGIELLTEHPRTAERIAGSGHEVHVWTVNTEEHLLRCLELGVRAVITDRPAYLLELLDG